MIHWQEMIPPFFSAVLISICISMAGSQAQAADLDEAYQAPPPAGAAGGRIMDPRCRVIPQPEPNLYGDTTRFRPTLICMSRGIYADLYKPYPVYRRYYGWIDDLFTFP